VTLAALAQRARAAFRQQFGGEPELLVQAPGRVNLIGEHTDYNAGFVLPCALDRRTVVAARRSGDLKVSAIALDFDAALDRFELAAPIPRSPATWSNYIRGVANVLLSRPAKLPGVEMAVAGDVPIGAGLSSSASVEVAVAHVFNSLGRLGLDARDIALAAQRAENEFVGCACGIMDQLVSASARAGCALLIDCDSLDTRSVPMLREAAVIVIHSRVRRGLVTSAYNERRRQCEAAARHYGVRALRDLDVEALETRRGDLDPLIFRRARHVVTENHRTLEAADALARGSLDRMAALMAQSHASMRDDFEITVPPIDALVRIVAETLDGAGGARMTGGGFGGCVVALAPASLVSAVGESVARGYRSPDGLHAEVIICDPAQGAGSFSDPLP